jgi:cytochrome c peroxidase
MTRTKTIGAVLGAMTIAAPFVSAQRSGPYGVGPVWWNASQGGPLPWEESYENPDGMVSILNKNGAVHTENHPFFESLGTNRRACVTCHQPSNGMSVSVTSLRERWSETDGRDPVFAAADGSNCPDLPQGDERSHSLLLNRGLFRIALPWPPKAPNGSAIKPEFRIEVVRDPTACNLSSVYGLASKTPAVSVFRRPRVAANLEYVINGSSLMADGREPSLTTQAVSAARDHEQADHAPSADQLRRIVDFEMQIFAAQASDVRGGLLTEKDGPVVLGTDNLASGNAGIRGARDERVVLSFDVWKKRQGDVDVQRDFRASVARGSAVFFTRRFRAGNETMTCASCHTAANAPGTKPWMDIGTTNVRPEHASAELPLFRITCDASAPAHPVWGRVIYTQDPGRALISGKCADVGSIVPQQLRALAARAPYFTNGSAKTLGELVDFYDQYFEIGYSEQEKQDLTNFLRVL